MNDKIKDYLDADEAASLSGLSRAMVDYLCRTKLLVPTIPQRRGRGRQRRYSFGDVILLRALARMLEAGISVLHLKRSLQSLRKYHPEITPNTLPATHIVTDGRTIYFKHGKDGLEELTKGQFSFAFIVELERVKREVLDELTIETTAKAGQFLYKLRNTSRAA